MFKMTPVPDCDGKRFCRTCAAFLPVAQFDKTGPRRFYCTFHIRSLFKTRGVNERATINLRKRLRRDLIALSGKAVIHMTHEELLGLIKHAKKTPSDYHDLCLLPYDPEKPVTANNVLLASKEQRRFLVALYKMNQDACQYKEAVQRIHARMPLVLSDQNATSFTAVPE